MLLHSGRVSCNDQVEACGEGAEVGYSDGHVPEASTPLHDQYDAELIDGDDVGYIDSDVNVDCTLYLGESVSRSPPVVEYVAFASLFPHRPHLRHRVAPVFWLFLFEFFSCSVWAPAV